MTDTMEVTDKRVSWSDERITMLKDMWMAGRSASEIANAMGDVSRNAVCGKVDRLGLSALNKPTPTSAIVSARIRKARSASGKNSKPVAQPIYCASADPVPLHISFDELKNSVCRWPLGEGPHFTYCGHYAVPGRSYCASHHRRAYMPVSNKALPIRNAELSRGRGGVFGTGRSL